MYIQFISNIKQGENDNKIDFTALVNISSYEGLVAYEFKDPSTDVLNRIEVSEEAINIFIAQNTINIKLNKMCNVNYDTPQGMIVFQSFGKKFEIKKDNIKFEYNLEQNGNTLGEYFIELKILEKIGNK